MERWIIRLTALGCAAGSGGLLWVFGVFVVVPWRAGRMLALSGSELQILGASLLIGIAVGICALHLLALGEKPTAPRRYAALRAALIAFMLAAIILGIRWTVQRG